MNDSFPKKPVRQTIVDNFIEQLKNGTAPIGYSFEAGELLPPVNGATGRQYSSVNRLILSQRGETDPRWLTERQADDLGYQVKDFAKARQLMFWEYSQEVPTYNPDGSPRLNNIGNQVMERQRRDRPVLRVYTIYHARDLLTHDGQELPPYEPPTLNQDPLDRASTILANSGATIRHDPSPNAAMYKSRADLIVLPDKSLVMDEEYYSQAIKELVVWTSHPDRLNWREGMVTYNQQIKVGMQEVMAGAMIAQDLGLKYEPDATRKSYEYWIKALEADPEIFFQAAAEAEKIRNYVMGLERMQAHDLDDNLRDRPSQEYYS